MPKKHQPIRRALTPEKQIQYWVEGASIHNTTRDECCPDFSCCNPQLRAPLEVRQKFRDADEDARQRMLVEFLGAMLKAHYFDVTTSEGEVPKNA